MEVATIGEFENVVVFKNVFVDIVSIGETEEVSLTSAKWSKTPVGSSLILLTRSHWSA